VYVAFFSFFFRGLEVPMKGCPVERPWRMALLVPAVRISFV
jgi:hypothetical protein